jgi:hypothetical protein
MQRDRCGARAAVVLTLPRSVCRTWLAAVLFAVGILISTSVGVAPAVGASPVAPDAPPSSVVPDAPPGSLGPVLPATPPGSVGPVRPDTPSPSSPGARPSSPGGSTRSGGQASGAGPVATVVSTVPPVSGVTFIVGRRTFRTDRNGRVTLPLRPDIPFRLQVDTPDVQIARDVRTHVGKWYGTVKSKNVKATIHFRYRIGLAFDAPRGADLRNGAISLVRLTSSTGQVLKIEGDAVNQDVWVDGTRVVSLGGGLETKDVQYSVASVEIRGANVVNRGAQRFTPSRERVFRIETLWHKVHFSSRDLLFGSPIGSAVILTYPDGSRDHIAFADNAEITVEALPRGKYTVSVEGPGTSFTRPLTLSKDQTVDLQMLSYLDLAVVFGLLVLVAGGLLLFGRGRSRLRRFRLSRQVGTTVEAETGER